MARWGELKREFSRGGCKKDSEGDKEIARLLNIN